MANVERTYTIPLRKEWLKAVKYQRAKKAVRAIREFLARHMKVEMENVKLGKYLNLVLWSHGIKSPPSKVRVNVVKDDKGVVMAELVGAPVEKKPEAPKKGAKKEEVKPAEKKPEIVPKSEEKKVVPAKPAETKPAVPKSPAPAPVKQAIAPKQQTGQIIR